MCALLESHFQLGRQSDSPDERFRRIRSMSQYPKLLHYKHSEDSTRSLVPQPHQIKTRSSRFSHLGLGTVRAIRYLPNPPPAQYTRITPQEPIVLLQMFSHDDLSCYPFLRR